MLAASLSTGSLSPLRSFVVDAADHANIEIARSELHNLLRKPDAKENPLAGIPLLVRLVGRGPVPAGIPSAVAWSRLRSHFSAVSL